MDTSDKLCFCCFKVAHVDIGDAGLPEFVYIYIYILYYMYIDIYIATCTSLWWITWMCLKITEVPIPSQLLGNDGSGIYGPSLDLIEVILYYGATLKNAATKFARAQFDIGRRQI